MIAKRIFDLLLSVPGLVILLPLFVMLAIWIKLDSPGPVLFRQLRVGLHGKAFRVLKFRTMRADAEKSGPSVTVSADSRITGSGKVLRKYKLDELPQLINVIRGEMSLVGPRPEVPEYVAYYSEAEKAKIFSVPPGITDLASIEYRDESDLLSESDDPLKTYVEQIMPAKLAYYNSYVERRSMWLDIKIILRTLKVIVSH